jgi:hypothetical protein
MLVSNPSCSGIRLASVAIEIISNTSVGGSRGCTFTLITYCVVGETWTWLWCNRAAFAHTWLSSATRRWNGIPSIGFAHCVLKALVHLCPCQGTSFRHHVKYEHYTVSKVGPTLLGCMLFGALPRCPSRPTKTLQEELHAHKDTCSCDMGRRRWT